MPRNADLIKRLLIKLIWYKPYELEGGFCGFGYPAHDGGASIIPARGHCLEGFPGFVHPGISLAAHELGHTFGLTHYFHKDSSIMSYGDYRHELLRCNAEWLNNHRYFNPQKTLTNNSDTEIEMSPPEISSLFNIRLRFKITDSDGLHQAQLLVTSASHGLLSVRAQDHTSLVLLDCKSLNGGSDTVEFDAAALLETPAPAVALLVIDVHGNITGKSFEINITSQLPTGKVVSIPDAVLAAAVRETLGLAPNSPITQQDMLRLTRLYAGLSARRKQQGFQPIKDLTGVEHAINLKYLFLGGNQIRDISVLTTLTQLKEVGLGTNQIKDFPSLKESTQLTNLHLSGNPITDITPLAELTQLTQLSLSGNSISDITPLAGLTELRDLRLGVPINDITPLKELTQLEILIIRYSSIRDITPLAGFTELRQLRLQNNQISDITPLKELTKQLEDLYLQNNQISDITPLKELTKVKTLNLENNQISDITPLKELTQLEDLYLQNNQISDITPLKELIKVRKLRLSNNQITDVSPLAGLVGLTWLYLDGNPIKDREPLFELLRKKPGPVFIILKRGGKALPVTLSHFRAEHTNAGVVLKWITESEVDNAGFYIHRSETKDGEFAVVNPTMIQGAGTTGERSNYTWTDTTAKPNVAYYYRIEDISHAGVRKQLATIRMRGLVSATGKLTTRWADLKTQN